MTCIRLFTILCALLALAGCAAPYQPYVSENAGKVRIKLANGAIFSSVAGNLRTSVNGQCGEPVRLPQLFPYFGAPVVQKYPRPGSDAANTYPRAQMFGASDPARSDSAELQLAPGRYLFSFFAGIGLSNCGLGAFIDLDPKRQYEIEFRFDTTARQCLINATRLDESEGRAEWRKYEFLSGEACRK